MNSCLPGRPKRRRLGYIPPCLPSRAELPPLGLDWLHEIKHASLEMRASTAAVLRQSEHDQPPSSDRLTSHRETASAPFRVLPLPSKCHLLASSRRTAAGTYAWAAKRIDLY
jgi:hypothetical protein